MSNSIPPLSEYAAGRDLIFELQNSTAKELALRWARYQLDFAYLKDNNQMVATWPSDTQFKIDAAGDVISEFELQASTAQPLKKVSDLSFLKNDFDKSHEDLPVLNQPVTWPNEIDFKIVGNGNITAGITLNSPVEHSAAKWTAFQDSFLANAAGHDWCMAIPGDVLASKFKKSITGAVTSYPGDINIIINEVTSVAWSHEGLLVKGRGTQKTRCAHLDFKFWVRFSFKIDAASGSLFLEVVGSDATLDLWDGVESFICNLFKGRIVEFVSNLFSGFIGAVNELREFADTVENPGITIQTKGFRLQNLGFKLIESGSIGRTQDLIVEDAGLRLFGSLFVPSPTPPKLELSDKDLVFIESAGSACAEKDPIFPSLNLEISNTGGYPLCICGAWIEPKADFTISPPMNNPSLSGNHKLEGLPYLLLGSDSPDWSGPLGLNIQYKGDRSANQQTKLRLLTNDPSSWPTNIPIHAYVTGQPNLIVEPPQACIRIANTKNALGRVELVGMCEEKRVGGLESPAKTLRFHNTGSGPLFICSFRLDDPNNDVFEFTERTGLLPLYRSYSKDAFTLGPGGWAEIGILFFPKKALVKYDASIQIKLKAASGDLPDVSIPIHGFVETLPKIMESPIGINKERIKHYVDLVRELVCSGLNTDIQLSADLFERIPPDKVKMPPPCDLIRLGAIYLPELPEEAEVVIESAQGSEYIRDFSGRSSRNLIFDFQGATLDNPPDALPRVVRCRGMKENQLSELRFQMSGHFMEPVGSIARPGLSQSILGTKNFLYLCGDSGLQVIDWQDISEHKVMPPMDLGSFHALAYSDGLLLALGENVLSAFDLTKPDRPALSATAKIPSLTTGLAACGGDIYVLSDNLVLLYHLDRTGFVEDSSLKLSSTGLFIGAGYNYSYIGPEDGLHVATNPSHSGLEDVISTQWEGPPNSLGHYGQLILASRQNSADFYRVRSNFQAIKVGTQQGAHFSQGFIPDVEHERLYRLESDGTIKPWRIRTMRLDRSQFQDMIELRYQPERGGKTP